jgi:hypothetical protein
MKIEQIPKGTVELNIEPICEIDGCYDESTRYFCNSNVDDPDALLVWSLCDDHADRYTDKQDK